MFRFMYKTLMFRYRTIDFNIHFNVRYLQTLQSVKAIVDTTGDQQSLTVSYLTNACRLSLEKAIKASKLVDIKNSEKPNSVLLLLRAHGFDTSHITILVSKNPSILSADADKIIKPKIEYFESVGIRGPALVTFLCSNKMILMSSLKNHIIPTFDFLLGFLKTNENLIAALKQSTRIISSNFQKVMVPNMNALRVHGVPEPHIVRLIMLKPQSLVLRPDMFENVVHAIKEMGFEPTSRSFIMGVRSMSILGKATWESKKETLMSYGWSESDFLLAFKRQPIVMLVSLKKIRLLMDFFVKKMGMKSSDVVRCPNLLLFSLERRIIPRFSVLKVLLSKKLSKKDIDVVWYLNMRKKDFEEKYLTCHMDQYPEVMEAYKNSLHSSDLVTGL